MPGPHRHCEAKGHVGGTRLRGEQAVKHARQVSGKLYCAACNKRRREEGDKDLDGSSCSSRSSSSSSSGSGGSSSSTASSRSTDERESKGEQSCPYRGPIIVFKN